MKERWDPALVALGLLTAVAGWSLHATLGPPHTYWTIDNGGKALVVDELRAHPGDCSISYPGKDVDPDFRFFPQPLGGSEPYGVLRGSRVLSQYHQPFVWLAVPLANLFGFGGLAILPALAGGLTVMLGGTLVARWTGSKTGGRVAAALLFAATPFLFYSSVFWEHTLVCACVLGGLILLQFPERSRPLTAGLLLGAACLLREEMLLLLAAAAAALAIAGRAREIVRLAVGAGAGLFLLLAFQKETTGSWTGVHVGVNRPVPFVNVLDAIDGLITSPGLSGLPALAGGALLLAWLAAGVLLRRESPAGPATAAGALAATLIVSALAWIRFPAGQDRALALIESNSALVFLPWAIVGPFLTRTIDRNDVVQWTARLFVFLFLVLVPARSITGVHPGPRMLLPVMPVAAALAVGLVVGRWSLAGRGRAPVIALLAGLVLVGAAWNVRSLSILGGKREAAGRIAAALESDPRGVVATDLFWLPTEISPLWREKRFHLVSGNEDLAELAARLGESGERELLVVLAAGSIDSPPAARVRSPGFPSFDVDLHVQRIGAGR